MTKPIVLTVPERLNFPEILPARGKTIEMEIVKNLIERVRFLPEEIEECEMADLPDGRVKWNNNKAKPREFQFESSEIAVIQKGIKALDDMENVSLRTLELVKKFK